MFVEVIKHIVYDNFNKKQAFEGSIKDCIKYLHGNNTYQIGYSKLTFKTIKVMDWETQIRYYMWPKDPNEFDLCDYPNKRRNAQYLGPIVLEI